MKCQALYKVFTGTEGNLLQDEGKNIKQQDQRLTAFL
jgi:hypothetical protein